jgi:hypothetical protein
MYRLLVPLQISVVLYRTEPHPPVGGA